jgi:hypothetical protein
MVIIIHMTKAAISPGRYTTDNNCNSCICLYTGNCTSGLTVVGTMVTGVGNYILSFVMSVYILVAIYSTIFAYRRLQRPGVSKEIRTMFLKKHYIYVGVFICIWTIQLSQNYFQLFNPPYGTTTLGDYKVHALDTLSAAMGFRGSEQMKMAN